MAALDEIADLLELEGASSFRVRAYRTAGLRVRDLPQPVLIFATKQPLDELPGIGADLAHTIDELARTGSTPLLRELRKTHPAGQRALLALPGLGPKRVRLLRELLHVEDLAGLRRAVAKGEVAGARGLGRALERQLRAAVAREPAEVRFRLDVADALAAHVLGAICAVAGVTRAEVAGSLRRRKETVRDLDVLVAARTSAPVVAALCALPGVVEVLARGDTRAAVTLEVAGSAPLQVDLRVVEPAAFGAALVYFTGSKDHNIALRRRAQARGLKVNEYGVFRGDRRVAGGTEEQVYAALALPFIPPELREARGEIEAAEAGALPELIDLGDVRGDLHLHTDASDGRDSLHDMVRAAKERGYAWLAVTDHAKGMGMVHGLDAGRLRRQRAAIARVADDVGVEVLCGAEVDLRPDGALALGDAALAELDVVIASVHSAFTLTKAAQTARLLRAVEHPLVRVLGHPSGRLLGGREPIDADWPRVIARAQERGVALEVNGQPDRLDANDTLARLAKGAGASIALGSDAHAAPQLDYLRYAVGQARRGWVERRDVWNALPLRSLRARLRRR